MKTIITSTGNQLNSIFDLRFGRAGWFCLYDDQSGEISFIENENINSQSGAGTKTVEKVVELGAQKVISGDFGPKAKELLEKFNIQMVLLQDDNSTVQHIIDKLKS
ncbi:dinitrogenase iron-molybdenum cofactor biosynthesis protein [Labilibaculum sp. A4]|uniref:Dinitrogenase iron-molybdenum cofactor biosynthesis protein n=1 Tax=Labilibaculum euxinus TaxID=2686357 RepID=A0A425YFL6_9BACT|nr:MULTISPECIES: NifB/NifX family molybdenum-iron cluster-binding protein [Labilibaculum]MBN2598208.1 dinitrogenase iron-molybdenum cofactor biosynthesis protein [Marinifilaceae bacterium]MDQ1770521.1 NifB/NifX family molybdenum-iron cluster-binding protein [Labilibaculum euxinus]MUP38697.1 dinitrogenase iron-molybdenum cofactor biosynthesis protein [Labilibaculum euxinus]MVB07902.1 dinitrogenase iron-molybdenum cofactor biosynthesis protein [Labilibaculum euxinus]MWN75260.1 dinitrogenase iron